MNKNVFLIFVLLIIVSMLIIPVMASSLNKIAISFEAGSFTVSFADFEIRGDIQHGRNGIMVWEDCSITGDGINLVGGTLSKTYSYDINVKGVEPTPPPPMIPRYGKGVLHYTVEVVFEDGTFVGNHMVSGEFKLNPYGHANPWNSDGYAVYHGTGAYLGWTWITSDVSINGEPQFESYMLIPESNLT